MGDFSPCEHGNFQGYCFDCHPGMCPHCYEEPCACAKWEAWWEEEKKRRSSSDIQHSGGTK